MTCIRVMRIGEYPYRLPEAGQHADRRNTNEPVIQNEQAPRETTEAEVLKKLGVAKPWVDECARKALANGTTIETELLHAGPVGENAYYAALARALKVPFMEVIDPAHVRDTPDLDNQLLAPSRLLLIRPHHLPVTAIIPQARRLLRTLAMLHRWPQLKERLVVTTPTAIRQAVWQTGARRRTNATVHALSEQGPQFSARTVMDGRQGFFAGSLTTGFVVAVTFGPALLLPIIHLCLSLFYAMTVALRFAAIVYRKRKPRYRNIGDTENALPVYTVMVALYREAEVAEQLVRTLQRLDWPRSLLDIKLVCEADDHETIDALKALSPGPQFEIVEVPPALPRTKPKALCYAMAAARGKYIAIYDAEDRPHPAQLREAYTKFSTAAPDVACLQAPLIITNASVSWISALFSLEYSALFRGLLPMLADGRMPMPLGGTSNHFRADALKAVGAWDPYNVTEDADIGMRLYRFGYRADVITCQTFEDAPVSTSVWIAQRTRWFKGWAQTWLILTRTPFRTAREMGVPAYALFHLMIGGMLISALAHPLLLVFIITAGLSLLYDTSSLHTLTLSLLILDAVILTASYTICTSLGWFSMVGQERIRVGWRWLATPLYWMMMSWAAWRALIQLYSKPFFWSKTPHSPSSGTKTQVP